MDRRIALVLALICLIVAAVGGQAPATSPKQAPPSTATTPTNATAPAKTPVRSLPAPVTVKSPPAASPPGDDLPPATIPEGGAAERLKGVQMVVGSLVLGWAVFSCF